MLRLITTASTVISYDFIYNRKLDESCAFIDNAERGNVHRYIALFLRFV